MKRALTSFDVPRTMSVSLMGLMAWALCVPPTLQAQDKKIFTHMADIRPGHEDALLDIFKPISEQFNNEYRALGTAYTTAEILYRQKRYDDAIRNFATVTTKGRKFPYMVDSSRI